MKTQYHEWKVTHSGWLLLSPILIANIDEEAPVPIPRWGLWWWFDLNLWIVDNVINLLVSLVNEESVGYLFRGVRELKKPRIIRVPAVEE